MQSLIQFDQMSWIQLHIVKLLMMIREEGFNKKRE